ncbi:hypothetical protein ACROYT_G025696 [Oculina patagonica]
MRPMISLETGKNAPREIRRKLKKTGDDSTRWPNKVRSHLFWRSVLNEKKMASQLEDIERIFQDISNHNKKVKSLEICNGVDVNHQLQLQKHKNHLASLKTMLIRLQTQSRFLESMAKENWSSTDNMELTEDQVNARNESKRDKQTIEELETDIGELAETLCIKHKVLKEKLELLEQRLATTKDKKTTYEMLKEKSYELAEKGEQKVQITPLSLQ